MTTLQIRINDENKTTFTSYNGSFSKTYLNGDETPVTFMYKTLKGMLKASKKLMTDDSKIIKIN